MLHVHIAVAYCYSVYDEKVQLTSQMLHVYIAVAYWYSVYDMKVLLAVSSTSCALLLHTAEHPRCCKHCQDTAFAQQVHYLEQNIDEQISQTGHVSLEFAKIQHKHRPQKFLLVQFSVLSKAGTVSRTQCRADT